MGVVGVMGGGVCGGDGGVCVVRGTCFTSGGVCGGCGGDGGGGLWG